MSSEHDARRSASSLSPSPCAEDSLIVDFIDHCVQHGLQDELIARYVCVMVRAMRESIEAQAALHASAHRDRLRRYEMSEMWGELARHSASPPHTSLAPSVQSVPQQEQAQHEAAAAAANANAQKAKEVYTAAVHYEPRTPSPLAYSHKTNKPQQHNTHTGEAVQVHKTDNTAASTTVPASDNTLPLSASAERPQQAEQPVARRYVVRGTRTSQLRQRMARSGSTSSASRSEPQQQLQHHRAPSSVSPTPVLSLAAQLTQAHRTPATTAASATVPCGSPVHLSPPPRLATRYNTTALVDNEGDVLPSQTLLRSFLASSRRTVQEAERVLQATPVAPTSAPAQRAGCYGNLTEQELSPFLAISPSSSEDC